MNEPYLEKNLKEADSKTSIEANWDFTRVVNTQLNRIMYLMTISDVDGSRKAIESLVSIIPESQKDESFKKDVYEAYFPLDKVMALDSMLKGKDLYFEQAKAKCSRDLLTSVINLADRKGWLFKQTKRD